MSRMVCQFSCGAASAVATKITLASHASCDVLVLNAFIKEEHADNRRFLADCQTWFRHPIIVLESQKYQASTDLVWSGKQFIKGPHGAPCSAELKRKVLLAQALPGDVNVVGFTADETDRFDALCDSFPDLQWSAPLIERGLDKGDVMAMVERAGIHLPEMYRLGYRNANCIGCPKGGQAYWQNIRADFPWRFQAISNLQEGIRTRAALHGNKEDGADFLRFRSGPRKGERMSLAELPPGRGDMRAEPNFSCSFMCAMTEGEWQYGKAEEAAA